MRTHRQTSDRTRPPSEVEDVFGAIASGTNTSCGIRIDGRFECWGRYTDNDPQGSNRSLEPPGVCGDGVRDLSEVCDDGGTVGSDGCSADCESDESCGNGQLDPGELCDDGVEVYGDFCDATCNTSTLCPTGGLSNEEYCEDGLECTVGVCDEQLGCSQVPAAEETSCGGGAGSCRSGAAWCRSW